MNVSAVVTAAPEMEVHIHAAAAVGRYNYIIIIIIMEPLSVSLTKSMIDASIDI